jgi:RimJ/RimL family protein N-acetyltransferase
MIVTGKSIKLRSADLSDAAFILNLRLDEQRNRFLSRIENNLTRQTEWLNQYLEREKSEKEYYFIITDLSSEALGTVRLYDFQGDSFSWGSWLIKAGSPAQAAIESALLVYELAFYHLGFHQTHFEVMQGNAKVRAFHERFGAEIVRSDTTRDYFILSREGYERMREKYKKYLPEQLIVTC